jgi:maltose alpha-D-glucosyltransferase / alpha-amylase
MINDLWYKNAIIYCLSVATYMDANADGIGDFPGLMRRLDYLHGLGVTAVWLMPFQPSPGKDDGYDISDYYGVNPAYGTIGDFVEFTHAAKQRGIRVVIDLVVNHTSDQHPWFRDARSDPNSQYRDWYIWSDRKPPNAAKGMVFPGVQKSTWSYDREAKSWYFHRFYDFQPHLNTSNPKVQAEILKIMGFWIQLGVSGFRMDAVPFVISTKGLNVRRPVEQYDMLRRFREFLQWRQGDAIILAEANVLPGTDMEYFGDAGDRMHMMFNFQVNQTLFYALACADRQPLVKALYATRHRPATAQWGMFLRNHDELDLGRLTQRQRQKVFDAFGPSRDMQLYDRGIRRRLAPMFNGDRRRLELASRWCALAPDQGRPIPRQPAQSEFLLKHVPARGPASALYHRSSGDGGGACRNAKRGRRIRGSSSDRRDLPADRALSEILRSRALSSFERGVGDLARPCRASHDIDIGPPTAARARRVL